jgi:uncharacterized protein
MHPIKGCIFVSWEEHALKKELLLLIDLQKIDDSFRDLEVSKGTLPQELERLEKEERELIGSRKSSSERLKELEIDLSRREKRDVELKAKVTELQERLFATQTNQEYEAVTREIDWHQDALEENDNSMQTGLEQNEELRTKLETDTARSSELETDLARMREQYKEHNVAAASQIGDLQGNRDELSSRIPKPLYTHYERIRKAKDGRGLVSVFRNSSCGGCYQTLPPQKINQIRRMNDLVLCEICGRILISDLLDEK